MELLVVIAMISILGAILFPVFARARENARRTSCASNLKQWAIAVHMYAQDYDEHLPGQSVNDPTGPWGMDPWSRLVEPYHKSDQLQDCPSAGKPSLGAADMYLYRSYGWNPQLNTTGTVADGVGGVSLASVQNSAETLMFGESYNGAVSGLTYGRYFMYLPSYWNWAYPGVKWWEMKVIAGAAGGGRLTQRHFEGANVAFIDGHVKYFKLPGALTVNNDLWDLN